jgi:hypothetical protein
MLAPEIELGDPLTLSGVDEDVPGTRALDGDEWPDTPRGTS